MIDKEKTRLAIESSTSDRLQLKWTEDIEEISAQHSFVLMIIIWDIDFMNNAMNIQQTVWTEY